MPAGQSARARAHDLERDADALREEAKRWNAGAEGEERVERVLADAGILALHDRLLEPGESQTNLDHLVVCRGGVLLIDAKNWIGAINASNGSLWQHRANAGGSPNFNKNAELDKVASMARSAAKRARVEVTPVLCLAAHGSNRFGDPQMVRGVMVVPVDSLAAWVQARPATLAPERVKPLAVELSTAFPPAVDPGLTLTSIGVAHAPREQIPQTAARRRRRFSRTERAPKRLGSRHGALRILVGSALLIVAAAVLPSVVRAAVHTAVASMPAGQSPTHAAGSGSSPLGRRHLDDWRIRAGLYEDHDQPSALPYVPDSGLGMWSDQCRHQRRTLKHFRHGLLAAPDPVLAKDALRFDHSVGHLLTACVMNDPVALHHARNAMTHYAAQANARYDVLLGFDPRDLGSPHVL